MDAGIAVRERHAPDFNRTNFDTLNTDPTVTVLCNRAASKGLAIQRYAAATTRTLQGWCGREDSNLRQSPLIVEGDSDDRARRPGEHRSGRTVGSDRAPS